MSHTAESDCNNFGLSVSPPQYADSVYLSEKCRPSAGEHVLLQSLSQRPKTTVHDAALAISANPAVAADNMDDFIRVNTHRDLHGRYIHSFTVFTFC